jgi:sarcosine oxidase subunit gamma
MSEAATTSVTESAPRSAAGIAAFRDHDAVRAALQTAFGVAPPTTAGFVQAGPVTLSCLSPTRYFATAPRDTNLPRSLAKYLAELAAVTDQSDLWVSYTLAGPAVRETLARLVPVDLAPEKFPVGTLALTRAGHLHVRLWRLAADSYEISVQRSCTDDLRHALGAGV